MTQVSAANEGKKLPIHQLKKTLVLASQSPRRKELLSQIGVQFQVDVSNFEEIESGLPPEELAIYNARGKAKEVATRHSEATIIGVDTIVLVSDPETSHHQILGKPKSLEHHRQILEALSGTTHKVISGLTLVETDKQGEIINTKEQAVTTLVTIDELSPEIIEAYIATGEGTDKAAGYAIQGLGSLFIEKIEGDYFNVVGLPVRSLMQLILKR